MILSPNCAPVIQGSDTQTARFQPIRVIGKGTFGVVFEVVDIHGAHFSVKKVLQNPRFKSREVEILRALDHPNCMHIREAYLVREGRPPRIFLNVVAELMPMDLSQLMKEQQSPAPELIKVFAYQIFRALAYIHSIGICHRDIKPPNVLVDPDTGRIQLCDFGSAKFVKIDEPSVSYIATRNYRAPELLFGSTHYGGSVDVWAAGCVAAQLANYGRPIFNSASNKEMIRTIAECIGSPTEDDMREIRGTERYDGEAIPAKEMALALPNGTPPQLLDLLRGIFVYSIGKRSSAQKCMEHPYFDEIRAASVILPNGNPFFLPTK